MLLITNRASEEQRKAIRQIVYGQAKGECFALFAGTFSHFLELQLVDINAKIDGRKSSFSVPGLVNIEVESFIPVTQKSSYQRELSGSLQMQPDGL